MHYVLSLRNATFLGTSTHWNGFQKFKVVN